MRIERALFAGGQRSEGKCTFLFCPNKHWLNPDWYHCAGVILETVKHLLSPSRCLLQSTISLSPIRLSFRESLSMPREGTAFGNQLSNAHLNTKSTISARLPVFVTLRLIYENQR